MSAEVVCSQCGRRFWRTSAPDDSPHCPDCRQRTESPPDAVPSTAADFLLALINPRFKGQRLGWGSVIAIGITAALAAFGFGVLGLIALSSPDTGLPPEFGYGMVGLAALCLLSGVACFVPSTRWWVLPALGFLIVGFIVVLRLARIFRA